MHCGFHLFSRKDQAYCSSAAAAAAAAAVAANASDASDASDAITIAGNPTTPWPPLLWVWGTSVSASNQVRESNPKQTGPEANGGAGVRVSSNKDCWGEEVCIVPAREAAAKVNPSTEYIPEGGAVESHTSASACALEPKPPQERRIRKYIRRGCGVTAPAGSEDLVGKAHNDSGRTKSKSVCLTR